MILNYIIKSFVFSGLVMLPLALSLKLFKKTSYDFKYIICLITLFLIPFLPLIQPIGAMERQAREIDGLRTMSWMPMQEKGNAIYPNPVEPGLAGSRSAAIESNDIIKPSSGSAVIDWRNLSLITLTSIYFAAVAILAVRLFLSFISQHHILKESAEIMDSDVSFIAEEVFSVMGLSDKIRLLSSRDVNIPFSMGIFRKIIVLPEIGFENPLALRQVLLHETAHIKRYDYLVTWLQRIMELLFFFNPLVWLLSSRISIYREMICDEYVIGNGKHRKDYAKTIIDSVSLYSRGVPLFCNATVGNRKDLSRRIEHIITGGIKYNKSIGFVIQSAIAASVLASIMFVSCMNLKTDEYQYGYAISKIRFSDGVAESLDEAKSLMFSAGVENETLDLMKRKLDELERIELQLREGSSYGIKMQLAYVLLHKGMLKERIGEFETLHYFEYEGVSDKEYNEAISLIEESGGNLDKANMYYMLAFTSRGWTMHENPMKTALEYFEKAGSEKGIVKTSTELMVIGLNSDLNFDEVKKYLPIVKKEAEKSDDDLMLGFIKAIDGFLSEGFPRSSELSAFSVGSFLIGYDEQASLKIDDSRISVIDSWGHAVNSPYSIIEMISMLSDLDTFAGEIFLPDSNKLEDIQSFSHYSMGLDTTIPEVSMIGEMDTRAGRFSDVYKISYETKDVDSYMKLNPWLKRFVGKRDVYYAKGVGIVRYDYFNSQMESVIELADYWVSDKGRESYFPLDRGNRWIYSAEGHTSESFKIAYEVENKTDKGYYLSEYCYETGVDLAR